MLHLRAQVNIVRIFLSPKIDLREMVGAGFGRDLNNAAVSSRVRYLAAVQLLRMPRGQDPAAAWANPVKWSEYER